MAARQCATCSTTTAGSSWRRRPCSGSARESTACSWRAKTWSPPPCFSGDCHYLDYRGFEGHFPSHRFVLVGFDDDASSAFVMDRLSPEPQECSYESLALSRNPPDFISTYNLWGKFHETSVGHSLEEAFASALGRSAMRMLGEDRSQAGDLRRRRWELPHHVRWVPRARPCGRPRVGQRGHAPRGRAIRNALDRAFRQPRRRRRTGRRCRVDVLRRNPGADPRSGNPALRVAGREDQIEGAHRCFQE